MCVCLRSRVRVRMCVRVVVRACVCAVVCGVCVCVSIRSVQCVRTRVFLWATEWSDGGDGWLVQILMEC